MKNAIIWAVFAILSTPVGAHATDARLAYRSPSGQYESVIATVPTCGVSSSGAPLICNASGTTSTSDARLAYKMPNGQYQAVIPTVLVCSVDSSGVPQICDFSSTPDLSSYLTTAAAASTYATISALNTQATNNAATYETIANAAALAKNTVNALQGSVTGDLSAAGSSLSLILGSSGLKLTMSYAASATGSLSIVSTSGSITPVDIYETAAWGATSFKGYTLDSGTVTTAATVIDSTFYLSSNAWGTYHIGVGGNLYVVDVFGSGAGKRTTLSWRKTL